MAYSNLKKIQRRLFNLLLLTIASSSLLIGCGDSVLKQGGLDYKTINAKKTAPLVMPPNFVRPIRDDRYDIPQAGSSTFSEYSQTSEQEQALLFSRDGKQAILPTINGIEVKGEGRLRWIVVEKNAQVLWPQIKNFWESNGFVIERNLPTAGILETEWAERKAEAPTGTGINRFFSDILDNINSYPERDKFRTRLELGEDENSSEIYITHQGLIEKRIKVSVDTVRKNWEVRPADTELEAEMLYRLSIWLGVEEEKAQAIKTAELATDANKIFETEGDEPAYLLIEKSFGPAWRSVGIALDRLGFTLEDRDRSKGIYYVRYIDPSINEKRKSLWQKLAFWRDKKKIVETQYQISVRGFDGGSKVFVLNNQGEIVSEAVGISILRLLKNEV